MKTIILAKTKKLAKLISQDIVGDKIYGSHSRQFDGYIVDGVIIHDSIYDLPDHQDTIDSAMLCLKDSESILTKEKRNEPNI